MNKASMASAAAALLVLAGVGSAQPPGITPEMINTTLPIEGAPLAEAGPYAVTSEPASGTQGLVVFRPTDLAAFPARDTLPVLVWGNGGCAIDTTRYGGFLSTIASHGFLVLGTVPATASDGRRSARRHRLGRGRERTRGLSAERQDRDTAGRRHGSVVRRVPVGQPGRRPARRYDRRLQLGRAARESRRSTGAVPDHGLAEGSARAGAARERSRARLPDGRVGRDIRRDRSRAAFYGARHNAGHTATVFHPGGGEYANVAANWLRYTFKNDRTAGTMFVGNDCSLCTNPNWDVKSKGM